MDEVGATAAGALLDPAECAALVQLWDDPARFRKTVT